MPLKFVAITPELKAVGEDKFTLTCLRCGAQWIRKGEKLPKSCANRECHSVCWDSFKTEKKKKIMVESIWKLEQNSKQESEISIEQEVKSEVIKNPAPEIFLKDKASEINDFCFSILELVEKEENISKLSNEDLDIINDFLNSTPKSLEELEVYTNLLKSIRLKLEEVV